MQVLIVDDHALFRSGLKLLLAGLDGSVSFEEAGSVERIPPIDPPPELVLLDLALPGASGPDAVAAVRARFPQATLVVVSADEDPRAIQRAVEAGAAGFVPKASRVDVLLTALRLVLAGGVYLPPQVLRLGRAGAGTAPAVARERSVAALTQRQRQALALAVRGLSNKAIARELGLSEGTVKQHLSSAFRVLDVANRTEAVYAAVGLDLPAPVPRGA